MEPPQQPHDPPGSVRFRTHRILGIIVLVGAATQGLSWLLRGPDAGVVAVVLVAMGGAFLVADVLDAHGRVRPAILLTCLAIRWRGRHPASRSPSRCSSASAPPPRQPV